MRDGRKQGAGHGGAARDSGVGWKEQRGQLPSKVGWLTNV